MFNLPTSANVLLTSLLFGLSLSACGQGSQSKTSSLQQIRGLCDWNEREVGETEDLGTGFTAAEQREATLGAHSALLSYDADGTTIALHSELITADAPALFREGAWVGEAPAEACSPELILPLVWKFETTDGAFAEQFDVDAKFAADMGQPVPARLDLEIELASISTPSLVRLGFDPQDWDNVHLILAANQDRDATGGEIAVYASRLRGTDAGEEVEEIIESDMARW